MDHDPIDALVRRAQAGDQEAFHRLVVELQQELRLFVAARASAIDLVEEVMQAAFVTAYERLATYEPRGTFVPWLKGIARNRLSEELRSRRRFSSVSDDELESALIGAQLEHLEAEAETETRADELARMRGCIDKLGPRARLMLSRRYGDDLPLARLAQQFKQSEEAIASVLHRLRRSLRECIEAARGPAT